MENTLEISESRLQNELALLLKNLHAKEKEGDRMRLPEARDLLQAHLSLDFADYFKFLKRYNYVMINRRDQSLLLTESGRRVAQGNADEEFTRDLREHFQQLLTEDAGFIDLGEGEEEFEKIAPPEDAAGEPQVPAPEQPPPQRRSQAQVAPSKGAKLDARFTKYDAIGSGGIGTVYRGRHNTLLVDVAIKEIKELFSYFNFLQRTEVVRHLKETVERMAALQHPLIVRIYDCNTEIAHPFFVMDYMAGGNLRQRLESESRLSAKDKLIVFTQVLYALDYAHRKGVVHGNLKPENILFDECGNAHLCDFGMTSLLKTDSSRPVPQLVTGSIAYLSPEQMRDRMVADARTDIYSLGIILYEMLTGRIPGRRSPLPSEAAKDIPKGVDELFEKMTEDEPEKRYPDFDAVLNDFYEKLDGSEFLSKGRAILFSGLRDEAQSQS